MTASDSASGFPAPARCPRCNAVLAADAPAGLCPACLVSAHFGSDIQSSIFDATAPAPPLLPQGSPAPPAPSTRDAALARIKPPAVAMMIVAAVHVGWLITALAMGVIIGLIAQKISGSSNGFSGKYFREMEGVMRLLSSLAVGWIILLAVAAGYVFRAAKNMLRLSRPKSAIIAASLLVAFGVLGSFYSVSVSIPLFSWSSAGFTRLWSILGAGIGIWALIVLTRPKIKAAFASPPPFPPPPFPPSLDTIESATRFPRGDFAPAAAVPSPIRQVSMPSTGLMIASAIQLLLATTTLVILLGFVSYRYENGADDLRLGGIGSLSVSSTITPGRGVAPLWLSQAPLIFGALALASLITFFGAWRMRRLRGHSLALAGAVLAIVTAQGLGLGIVFGLRALVLLTRRQIHAAFDSGSARRRSLSRGCLFALGLVMTLAGTLALSLATAEQIHKARRRAVRRPPCVEKSASATTPSATDISSASVTARYSSASSRNVSPLAGIYLA